MRLLRHTTRILPVLLVAACGGDSSRPDGDCANGLLLGDLVISELHANPAGADSGNEWFEIYNATEETLDLAGLRLVSSKEDATSEKEHVMSELALDSHDYAVVGGVLNEEGVRPEHVDYGYEGDLGDLRNSAGRLAVACGTRADARPTPRATTTSRRGAMRRRCSTANNSAHRAPPTTCASAAT
jgi:hypothetical protein